MTDDLRDTLNAALGFPGAKVLFASLYNWAEETMELFTTFPAPGSSFVPLAIGIGKQHQPRGFSALLVTSMPRWRQSYRRPQPRCPSTGTSQRLTGFTSSPQPHQPGGQPNEHSQLVLALGSGKLENKHAVEASFLRASTGVGGVY